jgi:phosphoglycerate dehydrogenase-like enzyme
VSRPGVVLHPRHPRGVEEALRSLDITLVVPDEDALPTAIGERGILVTFVWDELFLPGLRWVQSISAGHDQFPHDLFSQQGIVLTSASGVHGPQVAEHAFALLLALSRGVAVATRNAVEKTWQPMMLHELAGATMGVLGLGAVGEEIARRAKAWGMTVVGTKRKPDGYDGVADEVLAPEHTGEVFRRADAVVSALPGGTATDGIVTREMLESLGGWFVNVGRGNVVNETDIIAALDSGGLLGAGLDVFATEPLPASSPLWHHRRVVLTPHTAGFSPHYGRRLAAIVSDNLRAFGGEGEWRNRIV